LGTAEKEAGAENSGITEEDKNDGNAEGESGVSGGQGIVMNNDDI
jgi:hypothetical protein